MGLIRVRVVRESLSTQENILGSGVKYWDTVLGNITTAQNCDTEKYRKNRETNTCRSQ